MMNDYLGRVVRWDVGTTRVTGEIRAVIHVPREGGGLWDWTLHIQVLSAVGYDSRIFPTGKIIETTLNNVVFYSK